MDKQLLIDLVVITLWVEDDYHTAHEEVLYMDAMERLEGFVDSLNCGTNICHVCRGEGT